MQKGAEASTVTTIRVGPVPAPTPARLAEAVSALVDAGADRYLGAQLHALAAVLASWAAPHPDRARRGELEAALAEALASQNEDGVLDAARALAGFDRGAGPDVDWSAVSGG